MHSPTSRGPGGTPRECTFWGPTVGAPRRGGHAAGALGVALPGKVPAMSRTISILVRIDRIGHTVTLNVTGEVTDADQQELTRMTGRARALFPDAAVTVDRGP